MKIKFSHHYKKLNDRMFTTIRRITPRKLDYYSTNIGNIFDVEVKGEILFKAKLIQAFVVNFQFFKKDFLEYDTEGLYKFPNSKADWLLLFFKKVEK